MSTIHLSAIVRDGARVLLVSRGNAWGLPGGALASSDPTTEDGISRILREDFGVEVLDHEFVETYYGQADGDTGPAVYNVYRVEVWSGEPHLPATLRGAEIVWIELDKAGALNLNQTTREALRDAGASGTGDPALPGAPVLIVAGGTAILKSAVVRAICRQLPGAAHIDAEVLGGMIVSHGESRDDDLRNLLSGIEERGLLRANVVAVAMNCSLAGVRPVIDLAIESDEELWAYIEPLLGVAPVHCVMLPSGAVAADCAQTTFGLRIDRATDGADEIATRILSNLPAARIL